MGQVGVSATPWLGATGLSPGLGCEDVQVGPSGASASSSPKWASSQARSLAVVGVPGEWVCREWPSEVRAGNRE